MHEGPEKVNAEQAKRMLLSLRSDASCSARSALHARQEQLVKVQLYAAKRAHLHGEAVIE
jgi:hypothetical protein